MIFYEVSVEVRADLCAAFEDYMRNKHLPDILATGCFSHIRFDQAFSSENHALYRTCYQANTEDDYTRYLNQHASTMRADFMQHFPEGCVPSRQVFRELFQL